MLHYSLRALAQVGAACEAVVALPAGTEAAARQAVSGAGLEVPVKLVPGGAERQDSVRRALALTSAESELVLIHDAARPFAPPALFAACIEAAARSGAAIAAARLADTLKRVEDGAVVATLAREGLYLAQTPQVFGRPLLLKAHELALREGIQATDDALLVEKMGARVEVVEASALNFKITTPADLKFAEAFAALTSA